MSREHSGSHAYARCVFLGVAIDLSQKNSTACPVFTAYPALSCRPRRRRSHGVDWMNGKADAIIIIIFFLLPINRIQFVSHLRCLMIMDHGRDFDKDVTLSAVGPGSP
jgi:hypothetical protein